MSELVDLHVHSNISDGTMAPKEVVKLASECGLYAIALTDHDIVDGIEEAISAGKEYGVKIIPGIEISAEYKGTDVHILGYNIDYKNQEFEKKIAVCRDGRHNRNLVMVEKMRELGFDITWEEMLKRFGDKSITRAHFAKFLVDEGYVATKDEAFEKYLNPGCSCYIPRVKITPKEAIEMILSVGGKPVLAHPLLYHMSDEELNEAIGTFKGYGLMGIEALYSLNSEVDDKYVLSLAKKYDLNITGGSDFHGEIKPDISLGTGKGRLRVTKEDCSWIF